MSMTPDFHKERSSNPPRAMDDLDTLKRDRFELLSAYLDSEVTASERKQVEHWLATDPEIQCLYGRLLKLRHRLHNMPIPVPQESVDDTIEQVFTRIDRRPRLRLLLGGMGAAAAAVLIGAVASLGGGDRGFSPQIARQTRPDSGPVATGNRSSTEAMDPAALMVALDRPPVEIPEMSVNPELQQQGLELDWQRDVRELQ
jgi:anti-sigma factor RsiW